MLETDPPIGALLTSEPPAITDEEATEIARDVFGLEVELTKLTSERDANFRLVQNDGQSFVLKVTNPAEDPAVTNLQTEALVHIRRRDPDLPVPRVCETRDGRLEIRRSFGSGGESVVRVLTYLEGRQLHRVAASSRQRRAVAQCLARLDQVLADFTHPAADHDLLWDMKNASRLWSLVPSIADPRMRELVERQLAAFDREVAPVLPALRRQVIHNDLNPHNLLVDPASPDRVSGILDFGDMVETPLVVDLAVAASYHIQPEGPPLDEVAELVAAYNAINPLEEQEVDVLFDLIATRLVLTIAITNWRAERYPENRQYILRNNPPAQAALVQFSRLSREDARRALRHACGLE